MQTIDGDIADSSTVANLALMVSMHTGSTACAIFFLQQGAKFIDVEIFSRNCKCFINCMLLPILNESIPYVKYHAGVSLSKNDFYVKDYM